MKELMMSIIRTNYLGIVVRKHSTIGIQCMDSSLLEILKLVRNVLSQRHDRNT
jgi:hypothetical protein